MASENAKAVAREVIKTLGNSRKVNLGKIARKHGYAKRTSKTPSNITNTQSYKDEVDPFVRKMLQQRYRMIEAIEKKKLNKDKTRDLVDGIDKLTKNVQLLTGGATSRPNISDLLDSLESKNKKK